METIWGRFDPTCCCLGVFLVIGTWILVYQVLPSIIRWRNIQQQKKPWHDYDVDWDRYKKDD